MNQSGNDVVEAIEDGKIVRVTRDYALREGLLILRRQDLPKAITQDEPAAPYTRYRPERKFVDLDKYRKPLKVSDEITSSLIDNFGWTVISKRKERNISRRQLADALGVLEDDIKTFELGRLPKNDYVLVNKIENYFGIMLRKDPNAGRINLESKPHKESRFLRTQRDRVNADQKSANMDMTGGDIQIIDEVD